MKRIFNTIIFLVFVGAILFVGFKAKLIPNPFENRPTPSTSPTPTLVERDTLRVAVAKRPEKLLMASLQRLLQTENHKLELVEYNPQNVWLELAAGEIDLVIAPLGEAVKAQGRFQAGRFLLFTGESVGLDKVLAWPETENPLKVAVQSEAGTDFMARQMLPEATVVPAADARELEAWLKGKAVEAALIDTSANTPGIEEKFKVLSTTSPERPMPSVAVLSRVFAENAQKKEYTARRDTLTSALRSWNGLVGFLDTQPELLKSTLKTEAAEMGVDVDRLLADYNFLTPGRGRDALIEFQEQDRLKQTLDLLVLSGVLNLSAPDWSTTVETPTFLDPSWTLGRTSSPRPTPTIGTLPTPQPSVTPAATPTPTATPTPASTPTPPPPPAEFAASYHYRKFKMPDTWPEPAIEHATTDSNILTPAVSKKAVMTATSEYLYIHSWGAKKPSRVTLPSPLTSAPLSDGRNFFHAVDGQVAAMNSQGKPIWTVDVKGKPLGPSAVVHDKLVYAVETEGEGRLLCLDPLDGEILWEQTFNSAPASAPVISNLGPSYVVVVLDQKGQVRAYSLDNGANLWTHSLDEPSYLEPSAGYGKLAVTYPSGEVVLLSLEEGKRIWEAGLGSAQTAPPTLTSRGVLVPSKDTYLYLLSMESGDITWKTRLSQTMSEPAIIMGNQIVQSDEGGQVHILKTLDGALVTTIKVGGAWVSRVVPGKSHWAVTDSSGMYRVYRTP
jgi:outer membrane protein assembly factor BamB